MSLVRVLNSGRGDAAWNMALDEALLLAGTAPAEPVLRFYGWVEPAASFGYFQKYHEIAACTELRPLVRRPTGGGLVPHDRDWTYSLAFHPEHEWYALPAIESYRRVHEWLSRAFAQLNVQTGLAPCCNKPLPGQCFVGFEKYDLLWQGRKVAGAAQRRSRSGLLIQGSVQPPGALDRADWEAAVCSAASNFAGIPALNWEVPGKVHAVAGELMREKYQLESYHKKR